MTQNAYNPGNEKQNPMVAGEIKEQHNEMPKDTVEELITKLQEKRYAKFDEHTTIGEDRYLREFIDAEVRDALTTAHKKGVEVGFAKGQIVGKESVVSHLINEFGLPFERNNPNDSRT